MVAAFVWLNLLNSHFLRFYFSLVYIIFSTIRRQMLQSSASDRSVWEEQWVLLLVLLRLDIVYLHPCEFLLCLNMQYLYWNFVFYVIVLLLDHYIGSSVWVRFNDHRNRDRSFKIVLCFFFLKKTTRVFLFPNRYFLSSSSWEFLFTIIHC